MKGDEGNRLTTSCPTLEQRVSLQTRPEKNSVMYQRWDDLWFLHWEADAEALQLSLPPGLTIDRHHGKAYVAIVPFRMRAIRPRGLFAVPYLSYFLECNVRTYVHDANSIPGVWFYSLDTDRWLAYWVAQKFFRLPYVWSSMGFHRDGNSVRFQVQRRSERKACQYEFKSEGPTRTATPGSLEFFFLERYLLYSYNDRKRQLYRGRVHHKPYQVCDTTDEAWDVRPFDWNRLPMPAASPLHSCYSPGVSVEVFPLERVP